MADFVNTVMMAQGGRLAVKLSKDFTKLVEAAVSTNQPGEMTITVKITPSKTEDGLIQMTVKAKTKVNAPELGVAPALFYVTSEGELTQNDPRQTEMFDEIEKEMKKNG